VSRRDDLVVRLGGDEFAVLTAVPFTAAERDEFAARLVEEASAPVDVEVADGPAGRTGQVVTISASVGVAHSCDDDDDAEAYSYGDPAAVRAPLTGALDLLLRRADVALRQAKDLGRGRAQHFDVGRP